MFDDEVNDAIEMDQEEKFSIVPFTKEELKEATQLNQKSLRGLVDYYYSMQKLRCNIESKKRAKTQKYDNLDNPALFDDLNDQQHMLELKAAKILATFVKSKPLGKWVTSIKGLGPITTAGLMAHIDFNTCCCPQYKGKPQHERPKHNCSGLANISNVHSFAGLNPHQVWGKGEIRPWNARLKTTCWLIGESFKKCFSLKKSQMDDKELRMFIYETAKADGKILSSEELSTKFTKEKIRLAKKMENMDDPSWMYIRLYHDRIKYERINNEAGRYKEEALKKFEKYKTLNPFLQKKYAPQMKLLSEGILTPKAIEERSKRFAVKFFLGHYFEVGKALITNQPIERSVKPWIIAHGGHSKYIPPPNFPMS